MESTRAVISPTLTFKYYTRIIVPSLSLYSAGSLHLKNQLKLELSHYMPQRCLGGGSIAPTYSRPRHYMGCVVSVTPRPRYSPGERAPGTHYTGGWVGPKAGLDTEAKGKILSPLLGMEPQ
jgi:hypothetical protein